MLESNLLYTKIFKVKKLLAKFAKLLLTLQDIFVQLECTTKLVLKSKKANSLRLKQLLCYIVVGILKNSYFLNFKNKLN